MSGLEAFLADKYAPYVIAAYLSAVVVLGGLLASSILAGRRSRRELEKLEAERRR